MSLRKDAHAVRWGSSCGPRVSSWGARRPSRDFTRSHNRLISSAGHPGSQPRGYCSPSPSLSICLPLPFLHSVILGGGRRALDGGVYRIFKHQEMEPGSVEYTELSTLRSDIALANFFFFFFFPAPVSLGLGEKSGEQSVSVVSCLHALMHLLA